MKFDQFFKLWNELANGYLIKHRLIRPLKINKHLQNRFKESEITVEIATESISEIIWFMQTDDFWAGRKKKQGMAWFFQARGKAKEGEPNWAWFYEHRMTRLEDDESKEYEKAFKFSETNEEELP